MLRNGRKVLKKSVGLVLRSWAFFFQYFMMAILLCLVASFLAFRLSSQFSCVLFFRFFAVAHRFALTALFHSEVMNGTSLSRPLMVLVGASSFKMSFISKFQACA